MKRLFLLIVMSITLKLSMAQDTRQKIERACLDYIEGFYEGDSTKLIRSLKPSLYKFGYWKNKTTGVYEPDGSMSYRQALDYARNVLVKKNFAKPDSPKKKWKFLILEIVSRQPKFQHGGVSIIYYWRNRAING